MGGGVRSRLDPVPEEREDRVSTLFDPRIFNFIIMALYAANIIRWAAHGNMVDACYWMGALTITATVTFGYNH